MQLCSTPSKRLTTNPLTCKNAMLCYMIHCSICIPFYFWELTELINLIPLESLCLYTWHGILLDNVTLMLLWGQVLHFVRRLTQVENDDGWRRTSKKAPGSHKWCTYLTFQNTLASIFAWPQEYQACKVHVNVYHHVMCSIHSNNHNIIQNVHQNTDKTLDQSVHQLSRPKSARHSQNQKLRGLTSSSVEVTDCRRGEVPQACQEMCSGNCFCNLVPQASPLLYGTFTISTCRFQESSEELRSAVCLSSVSSWLYLEERKRQMKISHPFVLVTLWPSCVTFRRFQEICVPLSPYWLSNKLIEATQCRLAKEELLS